MTPKTVPFSKTFLENVEKQFPTPFYIYDEKAIRDNARRFRAAFAWNKGFKNYFAIKACPNPFLIKLLKDEGFGADCSSLPELLLARHVGLTGADIMFTSNNTPAREFIAAREANAIINLDDITHIPFLEQHAGLPERLCFRYNPGPLKGGNAIIGKPEEAKYGFTREQLFEGYKTLKAKGVKHFGLHTMVASNELNPQYFIDTAALLFELVIDLRKMIGITFDFINLGGGIGIPYRPDQDAVDLDLVSRGIQDAYNRIFIASGHPELDLLMECGRMVTGPYGYLVSRVTHIKKTYRTYVGLDACMANLMRPALYGSYHHITVMGKENAPRTLLCDVTGSLCENNDKFAINRELPQVDVGDLIVIHDTGAHGYAMGFQYNGKLRSAELLAREDGSILPIRRAETVDDYFATLDFNALKGF